MAFPATPLGVTVDLNLAGTWTPVTGYVSLEDNASQGKTAVTISRGRPDGSQQAQATRAQMRWNNADARFSPRNPGGAYYGSLGRNTPARISIPATGTYLRFADDNTSHITTPNTAGLNITGDIDVRFDMELNNYTPSILVSKWLAAGNQRSWALILNSDGTIELLANNSGTEGGDFGNRSLLPIPLGRTAVRVTAAHAAGTFTFYTAPSIAGPWTQLGGSYSVGAFTFFGATSAPVTIGYNPDIASALASGTPYGCMGKVYGCQVLSGIGGTTEASPDFTAATAGNATLTDAQGNVWTLAGTAEFSARAYRFHGECSALPQTWDVTGHDVWTPVAAAGLLRRLGQGNAPLDSAMKRAFTSRPAPFTPVAYWPCEDGQQSTQIAPAIGPFPMYVHGTASFAANSSFLCSLPLPTLNSSIWSGQVAQYPANGSLIVRFLMAVPTGTSTPDGAILVKATLKGAASFTAMVLRYRTGGGLQFQLYDHTGFAAIDTGNVSFGVTGQFDLVSMELNPAGGGNDTWRIFVQDVRESVGGIDSGLVAGGVTGTISSVQIGDGTVTDVAIGHVAVTGTFEDPSVFHQPFNAWQGETAANRFQRLCTENSLAYRICGYPDVSVAMGAQTVDTLVNLLQQCEDADSGMLFEPRDALALGYRTLASLCNQSAAVALDYSQGHLSPPMDPTDDDQFTRNDIIVTRAGGSSFEAVLADGSAMSTGAPPGGVGDYQFAQTQNLWQDSQLPDAAGWLLHLGTVNEERYPALSVDLASPDLVSLFAAVVGVRPGDFVSVVNLPSWLPPDLLGAIVWGQSEVLGNRVCRVTWQTQPYSPYGVLVAGSGAASDMRADTDGSTLHANITSAATSMQVDTTNAGSPLWTTAAGDFPFDVVMGGERITVTNITGTSSPQTFTITRSVNGVVKAHTAGEAVALFAPCYAALV